MTNSQNNKDYTMQTLHTGIIPGTVENHSPTYYNIYHKATGVLTHLVRFQKGPVQEAGLNGIFLEDLLLVCIDQVEHFQASPFACTENAALLRHLQDALASTRARQYERQLRGVQGYNKI